MQSDDFESIKLYKDFILKVDNLTGELYSLYINNINCSVGCCDCCNNIFNVSIIEGYFIEKAFNNLSSDQKELVIINVKNVKDKLDVDPNKKGSIKCPLLIDSKCIIYKDRPIVCRVFGYPMTDENSKQIATCGKNFISLRDNETTLKTISSKTLSLQSVMLSQYLLKELGKEIPENYIPPLYSILEILLNKINDNQL